MDVQRAAVQLELMTKQERGEAAVAERRARALRLMEELGVSREDVLEGVNACLEGRAPRADKELADHERVTLSRWFGKNGRGPADAALVWLEMMSRISKLRGLR